MKADQVLALIQAYVERDGDRFRRTALQIAAHEADGAPNVAQRIHVLLHTPRALERMLDKAVPLAIHGDLRGVLIEKRGVQLSDVVLTAAQRSTVARVLAEHKAADGFAAYGVRPRRRFLFAGPSGSGKSMLAGALGIELGLPVIVVQIHALVGKYLGETGAQLAKVFESLRALPGIYVLDEMDAIGEARGQGQDVGEMRRVVSGLLQLLDNEDTGSILIGTTNRLSAMDTALVRRFQLVVPFDRPSFQEVNTLVDKRLGTLGQKGGTFFSTDATRAWWQLDKAEHFSLAIIAEACDEAIRNMVLAGKSKLAPSDVAAALGAAAARVCAPPAAPHAPNGTEPTPKEVSS